jgi:4-hydroxybenzoate polyprenyltransferase
MRRNLRLAPSVRTLLVAFIALGVLLAFVAALTGLLLVLALVVALAVLNVVYLPRVALRLRLPVGWLALLLIPIMVVVGAVVGGGPGVAWGAGIWVLAIGMPRAIGREITRRAQRRIDSRRGDYDVTPRAATTDEPGSGATKPTAGPGARPLPRADDRGRGESGL